MARPPPITETPARRREPAARRIRPSAADGEVPLLRIKLAPPALGPVAIRRGALIERMDRFGARKLIFVTAPVGYGKTTLLAQWRDHLRRAERDCVWLSADTTRRNRDGFLHHLGEAFAPLLALEPSGTDTAATLCGALANALATRGKPAYLFIDDLDPDSDQEVLNTVETLLHATDDRLTIILSSRGALPLATGRLRAAGQVLEIDARDLAFSETETGAFLEAMLGSNLSPATRREIVERAQGWIAGVQMALDGSLWRGGRGREAEAVSGINRTIAAFFEQEVWARLTPDEQRFLLRTSILDRLVPALCEAVAGVADAGDMLERLAAKGAFVLPLDGEGAGVRYHRLFAEFLRHRLAREGEAMPAQLYRRASDWCIDHGMYAEGLRYALAADETEHVGELLAKCGDDLWQKGQLKSLMESTEHLPPHVMRRYPRLHLDRAWALATEARLDEAEGCIEEMRSYLASLHKDPKAGNREATIASLEEDILFGETMLVTARDELVTSEALARQWFANGPRSNSYRNASIEVVLLRARRDQYDCSTAERSRVRAQAFYAATGSIYGPIWLNSVYGRACILAGDLAEAEAILDQAYKDAILVQGADSPLAAMPAGFLAYVWYQQNRIEVARKLVDEHLPRKSSLGLDDHLIAVCVTACRLCELRGDRVGAVDILRRARKMAREKPLLSLGNHVTAERLRQTLAWGEVDDSMQLAQSEGLLVPVENFFPRPGVTVAAEPRAMARARLAIARGENYDALVLLRRWLRFVTDRGCQEPAIHFGILLAAALQMSGNTLAAQRQMIQTLHMARSCGFVRPFLDEGEPIRSLLAAVCHVTDATDPLTAAFYQQISAEIGTQGAATLPDSADDNEFEKGGAVFEPLNAREIEILRLVRTGRANRDIGIELGLSENTVKWHLSRAYEKLGARSRMQAVNRAQRLGLL